MAVGKVFWRGTHKTHYCKIDGKFVKLGVDRAYAEKRYREFCIEYGEIKNPTVADLVEVYLSHCVNKPMRPIKPPNSQEEAGHSRYSHQNVWRQVPAFDDR